MKIPLRIRLAFWLRRRGFIRLSNLVHPQRGAFYRLGLIDAVLLQAYEEGGFKAVDATYKRMIQSD